MKKLLFGLIATVMFGFVGSAQSKVRTITDSKEIIKIKDYLTGTGDFNPYNLDKIELVYQEGKSELDCILINSKDYDPKKPINKAVTIGYPNQTLGTVYFVRTNTQNNSSNLVDYYDSSNRLFYTANIDKDKELVTTVYTNKSSGCADAVLGCIEDAYTGHGWVSVWAVVQSAVLPQTTVAIAAACIVKNCR